MADFKTTAKLKDDKTIELHNEASDTITVEQFRQFFSQRMQQLDQMKGQIEAQTKELIEAEQVVQTDELKHFIELLKQSEQVKKVENLRESIQKMKLQVEQLEKDLIGLNEVVIKTRK